MNDFATAVAKDHQNEQNIEDGCRNSEKINRTLVRMIFQESSPGLRRRLGPPVKNQIGHRSFGNLETKPEQFAVNPGRAPGRIGYRHFADKITDFPIDSESSRTFGFDFPKKFKTLLVPADNSIRLHNDKRFAPRIPNSGKQNPEESIRYSSFWPLVCPFHYGQLLAKRKVLDSEIQGAFDLRPYEQNKISKSFHHDISLAGLCNFVNNFRKYEYLRRTIRSFQ